MKKILSILLLAGACVTMACELQSDEEKKNECMDNCSYIYLFCTAGCSTTACYGSCMDASFLCDLSCEE